MRKLALAMAALTLMAMALPASAHRKDHFTAHLTELNGSGAVGQAVLRMDEDGLEVGMTVKGLDAGLTHVQHIHGRAEAEAECPTIDRDVNADGFVDVAEGAPDYGPILLSLTPFPIANTGGVTKTRATYDLADGGKSLEVLAPLDTRVVVIHGLDVNGNGQYDSAFERAMPVACGEIVAQG